jgi:RHS repeat-associated protein
LNRLTRVTDPLGNKAYYQYDSVSNLVYTRDPRSSSTTDNTYATSYSQTPLNQLDTLTDPLGHQTRSTYDGDGNTTAVSLPNGLNEGFTYYNNDLLDQETLNNAQGSAQSYTYTYSPGNSLSSVADSNGGSSSFTYDLAGRVTGSTDANGCSLGYTWDRAGNLTGLTEPNGTVQYNYGKTNQLLSIVLPDSSTIYYDYDENGNVFQIRYPNNNDRKIGYYPNGWVDTIQDSGFTGDKTITYSYYNNGDIEEIDSSDNGNINTTGSQYSNNPANEISGDTYDANGNMTASGACVYTYDAEDRLLSVQQGSSAIATYAYNYDGARRSKTVGSVTTSYDWDASGNLVKESDTAGNTTYYYYTPGGSLIAMNKNGTTYIYHKDNRGDIVSVTDENNNLVDQYQYDPRGNLTSQSGTLSQPFMYAGYYYDSETGFYYLKSRYYSPELGRFITKDDYGNIDYGNPQTLDLYSYANDNPVNNTDPSGNIVTAWDEANLSSSEIAGVQAASDAWTAANATGDVAGMAAAHAAADAIRSGHLSSGETIDSSGYVQASSPQSLPKTGEPNSKSTLYNPDGSVKQERVYGPDGKAQQDTDYNHPGVNHDFPHNHDWDWSRTPPRGPAYVTLTGGIAIVICIILSPVGA